jgi:hypothetical protein
MNIEEEIKNINTYIDKIENSITKENNKLLTRNNLIKKKEKLLKELCDLDNQLIIINNNINYFTNRKNKLLDKEKRIYDNENIRIKEKHKQLKESKISELKVLINKSVKLHINKRIILNKIENYKNKILEFNELKKKIRTEFIKNIKQNNEIIKRQRKELNKNSISNKINDIEREILNISDNKTNIINKYNLGEIDNNLLNKELRNLEREKNRLIKQQKQFTKYLKPNSKNYLLKNKLPSNYKEYKTFLKYEEDKLNICNKQIIDNLIILEDTENKINDQYINKLLECDKIRCNTRWKKINDRIKEEINIYKNTFKNEINTLLINKNKIVNELANINSLLNKNIITKEKQITKDNQLLSNIKNRLNYLKILKNT